MRTNTYCQDAPIDDDMVVLDLMAPRWADHTTRTLITHRNNPPTRVEIKHYYKDGDLAEIDAVLVTEAVAKRLLDLGFVRGKPEWGYSDMSKLIITTFGEQAVFNARESLGQNFPDSLQWLEYLRWGK